MAKIDTMVQDFLSQKKIAVVGVSDKRETGYNLAYNKFKNDGYRSLRSTRVSAPSKVRHATPT